MDAFIDACIGRYRSVIAIFLLILIIGTATYRAIPKEQEPDIQIPIIYVSMHHEGISPEDAERLLIRPMEKELRAIEGIKEMKAYGSEGNASVSLEFHAGFDSGKALDDVREKVDIAKAELPSETDEPTVHEVNLSLFPVVNVILKGDVPERALLSLARDMKDKLEGLSNVLSVHIGGDREEAVEIVIDPLKMEAYGLSLDIAAKINTGFNQLVAAGALHNEQGKFAVKVPGLLEDLDDILGLPIKKHGNAVITLGDIASIRKTFKDPESFARVNGERAVVLEVSKRTGTNLIETVAEVKKLVEAERTFWPANLQVVYAQDKSQSILNMVRDLENNIILAVVLVMAVIFYYVGLRSSVLVAVSIPGAFLIGILVIAFLGYTLNIVVLFSLILSIGMLVDSAIVITEMADRKMADGMAPKASYALAARYMKWPIIASTLTTLVVFMPLLFWPGIVGQFMRFMPITLIATLTGSLFMAIIFVPTFGALMGRVRNMSREQQQALHAAESGDMEQLTGFMGVYYRTLKWVLRHAGKFATFIFLTLCGVYVFYGMFNAGVEFFPSIEPENARLQVRARGNLSVYEQNALVKEVEDRVLSLKDEVRVFYARAGRGGDSSQQNEAEDSIGTIFLEYANWDKRRPSAQILEEMKALTSRLGGVIVDAGEEKAGPTQDKPFELQIASRFPELLAPVVAQIREAMDKIGGFKDVEDSRPIPAIEWELEVNRPMADRFGTDVTSIGSFIKLATTGLKLSSYRPDDSDDEVDIVLRYPERYRNLSVLDAVRAITPEGAVPISNMVERKARQKVSTIQRSDGMRFMYIKANVAEGELVDDKVKAMQAYLASTTLDPKVSITFKGETEDQQETKTFLGRAFLLALFAMGLILLIQFNSLFSLGIIMSAVFLSTVGVLIGLLVTHQPFGIVMCGVGIISLSGIVVNNNIIFIDTFDKFRAEGMAVEEALLRTGVQRLRPILLTAGTTVLGLIPMVAGMNVDFFSMEVTFGAPSSQWWRQLSTTIAGGLSFATILTLLFTPSLLMLGERLRRRKH